MRIAVDARFLDSDETSEARDFTKEVFNRLTVQHPEHEFVFFIDSALNLSVNPSQNVTTIRIPPRPTNFFLFKWWYHFKLTVALRRQKVDGVVSTFGLRSPATLFPQLLIIRDLAFFQKSPLYKYKTSKFNKRYMGQSIKRAKAIVTLSDFVKKELSEKYPANKSAIQTIGSGVADFYRPVEWEEREAIKKQYAEGCEYFVFAGGLHPKSNFLNTLKAFSIFKKWQKSNMKLVIAGKFDVASEKDLEKLNTYKYRNEVFIKNDITDIQIASIIAASYAMIFPSFYDGFAIPVLAAMHCEVPVITSVNSSMSEIAADAALYADPAKPAEIAEQMKLLFKDEDLRNKLIEASKNRSKHFNWDKTAALLWQVIEETLSK